MKNKRDRADLPSDARQGPVATGRAAEHRAGDIGDINAIRGQVVFPDEDFERERVVHGAIDRYAANQRGHRDRPHQGGVRRHGVDRPGGLDAGRPGTGIGHVLDGGLQRLLRRPEAGGKAQARACAAICLPRVVRFYPTDAALTGKAIAVALAQTQPDGQVGVVCAADVLQPALQILQQAFGLPALADQPLLVAAQGGAFGFQGRVDTLVDRAFALAQALVLFALGAVVRRRGLQFGAQLPHLGHQGGDGIAGRVALDAERLHFFGGELWIAIGHGSRLVAATGEQPDAEEQHQQGDRQYQPLEQAITAHRRPPCRCDRGRPAAAAPPDRSGGSPAATTAAGRGRA